MLFAYVSLVCLCAEPSLLAMQNSFVTMNSDYVSLLSVQLSLLVMKLSYRMQTGRMQCKLRTNAVQNLSNEVLTYPTKQCTNINFEKRNT